MSQRKLFFLAILIGYLGFFYCSPAPIAAQEDKAADAAKEGAGEGEGEPTHHKSKLMWFIESSGMIGLFLLLCSIYFVATVVRLFLDLRPDVVAPPELVAKTEELIKAGDFKGVYNAAREDDSFFGRVLSTGISELPNGLADAREAMQHVGEAETVDMEKQISMLAVLGTLGPMIGLLGTLKGMIAAFSVIALSDTQLKASEVAGAISEALVLTAEGVALSVPAIYFFAVFRNKVSHLTVNTMLQADHLIRALANAAKARPGQAARAPAKV